MCGVQCSLQHQLLPKSDWTTDEQVCHLLTSLLPSILCMPVGLDQGALLTSSYTGLRIPLPNHQRDRKGAVGARGSRVNGRQEAHTRREVTV
jgi:hypothetical protein